MSDVDHVSIAVSDYAGSRDFYAAALAPLGMKLLMEGGSGAGFGRRFPHFWLRQSATRPITPTHVSFRARCREDVASFHAVAIRAGSKDYGEPGIRAHYHPGYYGAFVLDPDGHNIEAVVHERPRKSIVLRPSGGRAYDGGLEHRRRTTRATCVSASERASSRRACESLPAGRSPAPFARAHPARRSPQGAPTSA